MKRRHYFRNIFRSFILLSLLSMTFLEYLITKNIVPQRQYFPNSRKNPTKSEKSSLLNIYRNMETIFNPRNTSFKFWTSVEDVEYSVYEVFWPIVVFDCAGRMGNCLNSYAASVAMSLVYSNVTFAVNNLAYNKVRNLLHEDTTSMFPVFDKHIRYSLNTDIIYKDHENDTYSHVMRAIEAGIEERDRVGPGRIIYLTEFTGLRAFEGYEDQVRSAFKLKDDIKEKARAYLRHLRSSYEKNLTIIGFHIRRQDHTIFYQYHYGSHLPNMTYYRKVFDYYKAEFSPVLFLIVSDDFEYISNTFAGIEDTHLKETASAEEDFAVLASCDHSAFTVGTFGFWASFMAGGRVLYANMPNLLCFPLILDIQNKIPNFIPINP